MNEQQVINWLIEMAQDVAKQRKLDSFDKVIFDNRLKTMATIKAKLKRIDSFGGVETLIATALKTGEKESLFPVE